MFSLRERVSQDTNATECDDTAANSRRDTKSRRRMIVALLALAIGGESASAEDPSPLVVPNAPYELIEGDQFVRVSAPIQDPVPTPPVPDAPAAPAETDEKTEASEEKEEASAEETDEEKDEPSLSDLSDRLKAMEEDWDKYQEKLKKESADKKKKPATKIGGRVHADYWNFMSEDPGIGYLEHPDATSPEFGTDPEDRFVFRRVRLEMAGEVPQNMLWRIQVDFNNPATPEIKDVYLGWTNLPLGQDLLFGNQKRPMGLDHLNSSRYNVFAERPLAVEAFNEDARRLGLAMYGYDEASSLHWRYGIYNLENISTDGRYIGDSLQLGAYGRLSASPWYDEVSGGRGYQHLAISGSVCRPDGDATAADSNSNEARFRTRPLARSDSRWLDTGRINGAEWFEQIGFESITNLGAWQITAEYLATFLQRDPLVGASDDVTFHGGYIYISYFLTGEHMVYDRSSGTLGRVKPFENFFLVDRCGGGTGHGWGAWQLALRYDYLDLTDSNVLGGVQNSWTAGLNWHWTPYSKLQMNLVYGSIEDRRPVFDPVLARNFDGGDFWILGTRYQIDF